MNKLNNLNDLSNKLKQYEEFGFLDNKGNVRLVKDTTDGSVWVKKAVSESSAAAYKALIGKEYKNPVYIKEILPSEENNHKLYVIEEYLEGICLEDYLSQKGVLEENEARRLACGVCDGLTALHSLKIIHRDVTPSNIILLKNGYVKLIDFGISRIKKEASLRDTTILGTAGFAAPEQFGFTQTDVTSDIYSVGVLLNVMLTGKLPSEQTYRGRLDNITERCLKIDPHDRYPSAEELKRALLRAVNPFSRLIGSFGTLPGFRTGSRLNTTIAAIIYLIFGFLLSSACLFVVFNTGDSSLTLIIADFGCVLLPFFAAADYLGWQEKLPFIKGLNYSGRKIWGIIAACLIFSAALAAVYIITLNT